MNRTRRLLSRRGAVALSAAVVLLLGACGGSGDDTTEAPSNGSNPADSSKSPIVLGVAAPASGPFSEVSGTAGPAALAWQQWVNNEQGGIGGHPVKIVVKDTKSTAATATSVLTDLVEQDKAVAMIVADAAIEAPMAAYLSSENVPVVGAIGNDPTVWATYPNYFDLFALTPQGNAATFASAKASGVKKLGAMVCAEVPVCGEIDKAYKAAAPDYGIDYSGFITASASAPSFTGECLSMIDKKVDNIVLSLGLATIQRVVRDCLQQGYDGSFTVSSTSVSGKSFAEMADLKAIGSINQFPWWSDAAPVKKFREVMGTYGKDVDYETAASTGTWAALELFRKTMSEVGDTVSRDDVFNAYWQIKDETLDGLLPSPLTFTKGQPSVTPTCVWLYSYEDGELAAESNGEPGNGVTDDLQSSCLT